MVIIVLGFSFYQSSLAYSSLFSLVKQLDQVVFVELAAIVKLGLIRMAVIKEQEATIKIHQG